MASLQSLYDEIAKVSDSESEFVVQDGLVMVNYERGIRALLVECLTALLASKTMEYDWLREATLEQLDERLGPLYKEGRKINPDTISGAMLARALCVVGKNPFEVSKADEIVNLESRAWKEDAIRRLVKREIKPAQVQAMSLPSISRQDETFHAARMPLEMLLMLVRMINDVGVNTDLLMHVYATPRPLWPPWLPQQRVRERPRTKTHIREVWRTAGSDKTQSVLYASFKDVPSVSALLRAVIATLHARDHCTDAATLAALPRVRSWSVHQMDRNSPTTTADAFCFSVVVDKVDGTSATDRQLRPLMNALSKQLHIVSDTVPKEAAKYEDGKLHLLLDGLLAARMALLDDDATDNQLWLSRRSQDATQWFAGQKDPKWDTEPYIFEEANVPQSMVGAHIDARLAINPYCRHCGQRLPDGTRSWICASHVGLAPEDYW